MTMMTMPEPGRIPEFSTADRLRKARETAGISQDDMAAEIGVSRRSIVRYEGGAKPPRSALLLWSMRTGVPAAWLQTGNAPEADNGPEGDGGAECTPSDLNREPTDYRSNVTELRAA